MKITERELEILLKHREAIGELAYHEVLPMLGKETRIVTDRSGNRVLDFEIHEIHDTWFAMRIVGSQPEPPAKILFAEHAPGIWPFLPKAG